MGHWINCALGTKSTAFLTSAGLALGNGFKCRNLSRKALLTFSADPCYEIGIWANDPLTRGSTKDIAPQDSGTSGVLEFYCVIPRGGYIRKGDAAASSGRVTSTLLG
jgi:hypothetical protein